jgi:ATP synthase protein I
MDREKGSNHAPWWQPGLILFSRLSSWIVAPILIGIFIGKWLDRKYNTEPWLFLISVGIAFFISMFGVVKDALREMKRIDKEAEEKKEKKENEHS